jgi:hypothetical protein
VIFWVFFVPLNIFWAFPEFVFALKKYFEKKRKSTLPDWAEPEARPNPLRPHRPNPPAQRSPSGHQRPCPARPASRRHATRLGVRAKVRGSPRPYKSRRLSPRAPLLFPAASHLTSLRSTTPSSKQYAMADSVADLSSRARAEAVRGNLELRDGETSRRSPSPRLEVHWSAAITMRTCRLQAPRSPSSPSKSVCSRTSPSMVSTSLSFPRSTLPVFHLT